MDFVDMVSNSSARSAQPFGTLTASLAACVYGHWSITRVSDSVAQQVQKRFSAGMRDHLSFSNDRW